jgi:hypothetical protein
MAAGFSAPADKSVHGKMHMWLLRNQSKLLSLDVVCTMLLFFLHLFTSTFQIFTPEIVSIVQAISIILVSIIALSIVGKGVVPIIICVLGIVLIYNSIILPYYSIPEKQEFIFGGTKASFIQNSPEAVAVAANMHFFLGAGMVALGIILAYRPSILFTKNRPESLDSEWSKYPIWHDNTLLAEGRTDQAIPVKNLMTDQDRYLLWRYEYILANIYGTPHLVRPEGLVPKDSTDVFRDMVSGRVIGKARYSGYFI